MKKLTFLMLLLLCSCNSSAETETSFQGCVDQQEEQKENPLQCLTCSQNSCQEFIDICENDVDCQKFKFCYITDQETSMDFSHCILSYPRGAELWRNEVACVCNNCCDECGSYCDSRYGKIKDTQ